MNILLLDNNDSFTYNLVELLRGFAKVNLKVIRSDELRPDEAEKCDKIIFSPGPGLPQEHPAMFSILNNYSGKKPVLGICLGMQAIAIHFGGKLYNLPTVVHGQPRKLQITRPHYLFTEIPAGCTIGLYHSWAVSEPLPDCLEVTARSDDGVIMALAHKQLDICGVQFHPESVITAFGSNMLYNWLSV